jgi:putative MATE family efflux protein
VSGVGNTLLHPVPDREAAQAYAVPAPAANSAAMPAPGTPTPLAGPAAPRRRTELVALARLAGPLVGGNLLQMAIYSVDVLFVARLGPLAFAAATLGVYLYALCMFALSGMVGVAAALIAAELGRRRHAVREVRRSFRMALWLAVLAGLPVSVLLWHGEWLFRLAHQDPRVAAEAGGFLRVLLFALIPALFATAMRTAAAALGRPGYAMLVNGVALGVAVLANWLLVFGHAGFPAMGLRGSALASLVTGVAILIAYIAVLLLDPTLRRYRLLGRWWRVDPARLAELARLGTPIAMTLVFEAGLFGGAGFLMGLIGVTEVAAHAVALNLASFTFQVAIGVAQAGTIRVGLAYGAGDRRAVGRAGWTALVVGTGFMGLCALPMVVMPDVLIGLYLDRADPANARVIALAARFLLFAAAFQLFDGAQAVAAGALRGLQDTRVPMWIALASYWAVGFGIAVWLGFFAAWGGEGIWTGLLAGLVAASVALVARWVMRDRLALAGHA